MRVSSWLKRRLKSAFKDSWILRLKRVVRKIAKSGKLYGYPHFRIDLLILFNLTNKDLRQESSDRSKLVVSLTSFGRRIRGTRYTLYSLFAQSLKPDKVILWLAEGEKIPLCVDYFKRYGLEIRFCQDTRSYKKLLPALSAFPDSVIVTADDDVYYRRDWLQLLHSSYEQHPGTIHFHRGRTMAFDDSGNLLPYNNWPLLRADRMDTQSGRYLPTGAGGILYPPRIFDGTDVLDVALFTKLAPFADDLWFWAMGTLNAVEFRLVKDCQVDLLDTNPFYDIMIAPPPRLYVQNFKLGKNDEQLENILKYYGINTITLNTIDSHS